MPDGEPQSVLERKAQAQRRALGVGAVSISRALGRSLSIAADALWALGLTCQASGDETLAVDRGLALLPDDCLIVILEGDAGSHGLVALDRSLVTGLIEVQTLGKVTGFPLDTRPFTPTDAAMVAPLIDAALPRFSSMLATQPERAHLQGFAFGAHMDDAQTAALALVADHVQALTFSVGMARDTRRGDIVFLFPEPMKAPHSDASTAPGKHEEAMKQVPAHMQAILTRVHLPLSKAQALKPGDRLEISQNAIGAATLMVPGGHVVAKGKMGQMNGLRAVRICKETPLLHKPVELPSEPPVAKPVLSAAPKVDADFGQQMVPDVGLVSAAPLGEPMAELPTEVAQDAVTGG